MMDKIEKYIEENWDKCIKENRSDEDTLIGLPYPYVVPAVGHFDEMYYWDTYFTNKGLEICGRWAQVKNNTDNMLYLVNKFGFMPNGNRTYYLNRSQPPFLSLMVRDVFDYYKDKVWLTGAYKQLEKEYEFWMTKRISSMGLNHYDSDLSDINAEEIADCWAERTGFCPEGKAYDIARHTQMTCESGWDCTPRWGIEGYSYAQVELNSLLYCMEKNMEYFAKVLENSEEKKWSERANRRLELMRKFMTNDDGILVDYNFVTKTHSPILSAASFYPLFAKLASEENAKALVENLNRLEEKYGILSCEKNDTAGTYQWDYPNGWACLQYIAMVGLDNYGYKKEAKRVAQKYVELACRMFEESGNLWEKYNVAEGNINVTNEYEMPAMMGWSAGVYLASKKYLNI